MVVDVLSAVFCRFFISRFIVSHVVFVFVLVLLSGYEATVYGCEGSVRQNWEMSATGQLTLADYYGALYEGYLPMCLSGSVLVSTYSAGPRIRSTNVRRQA